MRSQFDHVLVDEYQDTNAQQADLLHDLASGGATITAVGDDAQAIYGFRNATQRNILEFPTRFGAHVVVLDRNHRSTPAILRTTNAVMAEAADEHKHDKSLWSSRPDGPDPSLVTCADEGAQSAAVCTRIVEQHERGVALRDQAVLFRAAHHSDLLELELTARRIPFVKYGGLRFLEAAHVKDLLCALRIVENPHDELAWFRVLQLVDGVGPATARAARARRQPRSTSESLPDRCADLAPRGTTTLGFSLVTPVRVRPPSACARGSTSAIETRYQNRERSVGRSRRARATARVGTEPRALPDRAGARSSVGHRRARGPAASRRRLPDAVHDPLRQGCEWSRVHVLHVSDGNLPSDMATGDEASIEEERRLLYVAMTRARDRLWCYRPLRYHTGLGRARLERPARVRPAEQVLHRRGRRHDGTRRRPASGRRGSAGRGGPRGCRG